MGKPNWSNRTMWTGDNLDIMRGMNRVYKLSNFLPWCTTGDLGPQLSCCAFYLFIRAHRT